MVYLLCTPHSEPQVLELLDRPAALQVLRHGHLLTVDGHSTNVGGKTGVVLAAVLAEVLVELADAEAAPGRLNDVAVE